jgi:hypothetical protein
MKELDELKLYGLPHKPDAKADPERHEKWSKHLSGPLTFVAPTFKIIESDRDPSVKDLKKIENAATSGNWSVIVNIDPSPAKYSLLKETGSFQTRIQIAPMQTGLTIYLSGLGSTVGAVVMYFRLERMLTL